MKFLAFVFGYLVGKISEFVYPTDFQIGYVEWKNSFERAFSSVNPKFISPKLQSFEGYFSGKNYELMGKVRLKKVSDFQLLLISSKTQPTSRKIF